MTSSVLAQATERTELLVAQMGKSKSVEGQKLRRRHADLEMLHFRERLSGQLGT